MSKILVSGLINLETTLRVDGFPIHYAPVHYPFFGVNSTLSGVGFNVALALSILGDTVRLLSMIGKDAAGRLAAMSLSENSLASEGVLPILEHTAQSVILYEASGRRQIHVDLKDIQEQEYPPEPFLAALQDCDCAVLCNVNFSRPFLEPARQMGKLVATDVHAISDLDDAYNRDFMAAAHILFMSDERLPAAPEGWAARVLERYPAEIVVIGLGSQGALLCVRRDGTFRRYPAVFTRPVVNTIGAGDALFSSFLHFYLPSGNPYLAMEKAAVFASYKIGVTGAAGGLLDEANLESQWTAVRASGAFGPPLPT